MATIIDFKTSGELAKKPSLDLLMKLVTQDLDKVNATTVSYTHLTLPTSQYV